jgi:hypothetical protein
VERRHPIGPAVVGGGPVFEQQADQGEHHALDAP